MHGENADASAWILGSGPDLPAAVSTCKVLTTSEACESASCTWNPRLTTPDVYDSSVWSSEPRRGYSSAFTAVDKTLSGAHTAATCSEACLLEAFVSGECRATVVYADKCKLYTAANSKIRTGGEYIFIPTGATSYELDYYYQEPSTAVNTCTHNIANRGDSGTVARCKYTTASWGNSAAGGTQKSHLKNCISITGGGTCVYNPRVIEQYSPAVAGAAHKWAE